VTVITEATVQLTVLLPALAALAGLLLRRRRALSGLVAVGAGALVLVLAVVQITETAVQSTVVSTFGPLPVGELQVPLTLLADRTAALVALAVAVVGLAVQVFSIWYLRDDARYAVFAATVSLFLAAMLLLVQSGDLVLTLVGWEVMGWCSYLLIGHVSARESARRAAHKAFLVTRFADIGFVIGLVILAVGAGSTDIAAVVTHWAGGSGSTSAALVASSPALTAALVLLLVGIAGKSGLIPFHDWLPDAMEGPTPASALIHAATMVAAGTFVLARFQSLYALDDPARSDEPPQGVLDHGLAQAQPRGDVLGAEGSVGAGIAGHEVAERVGHRLEEGARHADRQGGAQGVPQPGSILDDGPPFMPGDAHPDHLAGALEVNEPATHLTRTGLVDGAGDDPVQR